MKTFNDDELKKYMHSIRFFLPKSDDIDELKLFDLSYTDLLFLSTLVSNGFIDANEKLVIDNIGEIISQAILNNSEHIYSKRLSNYLTNSIFVGFEISKKAAIKHALESLLDISICDITHYWMNFMCSDFNEKNLPAELQSRLSNAKSVLTNNPELAYFLNCNATQVIMPTYSIYQSVVNLYSMNMDFVVESYLTLSHKVEFAIIYDEINLSEFISVRNSLKEGGCVFLFVRPSKLNKELRQYLLENRLIEIYHSSDDEYINNSFLKILKNKCSNDFILFESKEVTKELPYDELLASYNQPIYVTTESGDVVDFSRERVFNCNYNIGVQMLDVEKPKKDGYIAVRISDLCKPVLGVYKKPFLNYEVIETNDGDSNDIYLDSESIMILGKIKYLDNIPHTFQGMKYVIEFNEIDFWKEENDPKGAFLSLRENHLAIQRKYPNRILKVNHVNSTDGATFYVDSTEIFGLCLDEEKIDLDYFVLQMNEDYMKGQMSSISFDGMIEDVLFRRLYVLLPENRDEQRKIASLKKQDDLSVRITNMSEEIKLLRIQLKNEISIYRHSIRQNLVNISSSIALINRLVSKDNISKDLLLKSANNMEKSLFSINEDLDRMGDNIMGIENSPISILSLIEEWVKEPTILKPDSISLNLVVLNTELFNIRPMLNSNKASIIRLLEDIVGNAIRHGFEKGKLKGEIVINVSLNTINGNLVLSIKNNGMPLIDGITSNTFRLSGIKAGENANTGIGGYNVAKFVQFYKGFLDIRNINEAGYTVEVYIELPFL